LTYAVRVGVIGKYLGQLCGVIAIINLAPLAAALMLGEYALGWRYSVVTVILIVLAALALRLPTPSRLQMNEALVVSVLAELRVAGRCFCNGLIFPAPAPRPSHSFPLPSRFYQRNKA
jgi:hypothetical protein